MTRFQSVAINGNRIFYREAQNCPNYSFVARFSDVVTYVSGSDSGPS